MAVVQDGFSRGSNNEAELSIHSTIPVLSTESLICLIFHIALPLRMITVHFLVLLRSVF
jgi:hypothetical protein